MPYITHPDAPEKEESRQAAEDLAENLRAVYPGLRVRVDEMLRGHFEVVVEVPFRTVHLTWVERQEAAEQR